jgi:malate permease and related proteins
VSDIFLQVVVPAFVVIGVGVLLGRGLRLEMAPLNRISLYAAVPALVFTTLADADVAFDDVGRLLLANTAFMLVMGVLAWTVARAVHQRARRGLMATSMFGNAANIMLPVTLFAFGPAGLERALILYVFSALVLFTVGPVVLGGAQAGGTRRTLATVVRMPVLWASVIGLAVNLAGVTVPIGLERGLGILGNAAIPLVLLTLGLQIERSGLRRPSRVNVVGATLKLAVGPAIGYATAWLVGARDLDLAVLTLLAAMPPAVNNFMLALEFGAEGDEVARTVILSTVVATLSLTVVLAALAGVVPGVR